MFRVLDRFDMLMNRSTGFVPVFVCINVFLERLFTCFFFRLFIHSFVRREDFSRITVRRDYSLILKGERVENFPYLSLFLLKGNY